MKKGIFMLKHSNIFRQFSTYCAYFDSEMFKRVVSLCKLPTDITVARECSPKKVKEMLMGLEHFDGCSLLFKAKEAPSQVDGLPEGYLKWPSGKEIDIEIVAISPGSNL